MIQTVGQFSPVQSLNTSIFPLAQPNLHNEALRTNSIQPSPLPAPKFGSSSLGPWSGARQAVVEEGPFSKMLHEVVSGLRDRFAQLFGQPVVSTKTQFVGSTHDLARQRRGGSVPIHSLNVMA